jgi:hypothetical protein
MAHGVCAGCGKTSWLVPLYDERGGPLRCYLCAGEWNASYSRRPKWGRLIIKAIKLYEKEGGKCGDLTEMSFVAWGLVGGKVFGFGDEDTIGAEVPDITSELLAELLQLTHPDHHPPERMELAKRVTQELLALKPFVFPAPKPRKIEAPVSPERNAYLKVPAQHIKEPLQRYPCELCHTEPPMNYCDPCRAEWERRRAEERQIENEKQRKRYARKQSLRKAKRPPCPACGGQLPSETRMDAKYCSVRDDKPLSILPPQESRSRGPSDELAGESDASIG